MNDAQIGSAIHQLVAAWLDWHRELDQRERAQELEGRVEGYRIVNGGQTDSDGSWEITDAETGEVLARGVGHDSYDAAWHDSWMHIDRIGFDAFEASEQPTGDFGLPPGMARALEGWVLDKREEARRLLKQ